MKRKASTVSGYIAESGDAKKTLASLRRTIKAAAPKAVEGISYRIPVYKYNGMLVGFGAFRDHCSLFELSQKVIRAHSGALKGYKLGKGTVSFPADRPLPATLVKKLVKARIAENESKK